MRARPIFAREATGLVRQFSAFDAFVISSAAVAPGIWSIALQDFSVASAYPGADFVGSMHIGVLFMLPLAVTYVLLSMCMPRSGGDYVWISRLFHGVIGFMAGWAFWITCVMIVGASGVLWPTVFLNISLATIGYATGNAALVGLASSILSNVYVSFAFGLPFIVLACVVSALGPKNFARVMGVLFGLVLLSTIIGIGVLATSSHADFVAAMNGYGGTNITYDGIMNSAKSGGWSFTPESWSITLSSVPFAIFILTGFNYASAAAGEIKRVKTSMLYAIVGSLIATWVMVVVGCQLTVNVFGYNFLEAVVTLGSNWPLAAAPWAPTFISMLIHNLPVLILFQAGWLVEQLWCQAAFLIVATRYIFAFSFDRVLPTKLSNVNERLHFPLNATILSFIAALVFLVLTTFTTLIGQYLNVTAIAVLVWAAGSAVAIILPYKKKEIAASLPGAKWKVPFITIVGAFSMVLMLIAFYFAVTTPGVGPSTPGSNAIMVGIFLSGALIYGVSYAIRKKQGLDFSLAFSEIPPE